MSSVKPKLSGASGNAGPSLLEQMWAELDSIVDRLVEPGAVAEDGRDPGRAEGVAWCIALVQTPYAPDMEAIRVQAMERRAKREAE